MSIKDGPLCKEIFQTCNLTKMWAYVWPSEPLGWDDKDFEPQQILDLIRGVLEKPEMGENSAMILNLGLHYAESVSLADYQFLLKGVVDLLNEKDAKTGELKHKARVIWKTTTSMCKEKDIGSRLKSDWQRFLNLPVRKLRTDNPHPRVSCDEQASRPFSWLSRAREVGDGFTLQQMQATQVWIKGFLIAENWSKFYLSYQK